MTSTLRIAQILIFTGLLTFVSVSVMVSGFNHWFQGNSQMFQGHSIFDPMSAVITSPNSNITLAAQPAAFGPMVPKRLEPDPDDPHRVPIGGGFTGQLAVVNSNACAMDHPDFQDLSGKIALVSRGGCGFYYKVLLLQSWGALAVIVGDNVARRGLITMFNGGEIDEVVIPSVFVSKESFEVLKTVKVVNIASISESAGFLDTVAFLLVSPLFSLSLIYIILLFHRRYKMMKERLPKSYIENLPVRIWERPEVFECENESENGGREIRTEPDLVPSHDNDDDNNKDHQEDNTGPDPATSSHTSSHALTNTLAYAPAQNTDKDVGVKDESSTNNVTTTVTNDVDNMVSNSVDSSSTPMNKNSTGLGSLRTNVKSSGRRPSRKAPEKIWVSAGECIICLEDYVPGVSRVMQLPCGHEFHAECITKWLVNRKRTCPICKMDVTQDDEHTPLISRFMRSNRSRGRRAAAEFEDIPESDSEPLAIHPSEMQSLLISSYSTESSLGSTMGNSV